MNRNIHEYVYMHIYVDMRTGLRLAPDGYLLMYVYECIYIYIILYTYLHTLRYTLIYTHTNTCICTYIQTR